MPDKLEDRARGLELYLYMAIISEP